MEVGELPQSTIPRPESIKILGLKTYGCETRREEFTEGEKQDRRSIGHAAEW